MASIVDRRSIGQEIVLRVQSTGSGVKVIRYDGTGLADGYMSKRHLRYFYGEDAEEKATEYAERQREDIAEDRDCPVTVAEFDDSIAETLADVHESGGNEDGE